jgi:hypothetical protein
MVAAKDGKRRDDDQLKLASIGDGGRFIPGGYATRFRTSDQCRDL